jgi:DNA-binding MarR family transcriptional regulator
MTEIANRILLSKSALTPVIDRMETADLVRRDRRRRTRAS